ncbi:hypothetical protein BLNAU_16969 [Blattamonas nauphoetae]|uniref:Uncharacterized protein n=1 Tax=Blattamonas nauphoetae TaxID=2049346 RepID=A0ABQ9X7V2_9EUKA|nr:hypothetical protein BLNAU_16969 [Blattamonas nauphoetae]
MNKPIYQSEDTLLINYALIKLTDLFKLVKAAASPQTNGSVFITKDIQTALNDFTAAYSLLPSWAKEEKKTTHHRFTNWWLSHKQSFLLEDYRQIHQNLNNELESLKTNAAAEMDNWMVTLGKIFRNLQISIDSSIVPLHQTEIPNFERKTRPVKRFNKANYMYKSVPTSQHINNFLERPIDFLFRPSAYSLFSHILFNSNGYTKTSFKRSPSPAIFHIVTGTPGIGKSALRMPLITLTLSLGANEVKTARKGEPSFIFVNKNQINYKTDPKTKNKLPLPCDYDEQSCQSDKLASDGKSTITINKRHRPAIHMTRDTYCYTYKVKMSLPWEGKEEEGYHPNHVFSSPTDIGEVTVPSIHYFPHFFRLFVNQDNKVENRLRGTSWHIVDDFILYSDHIPQRDHVVLLTSPNKERWCHISGPKDVKAPILMYNVPTLLFPEMIHMFNAIPCPFEYNIDPDSMMMKSRESIRTQGMILRQVFTPLTANTKNDLIEVQSDKIQTEGDHYGKKTPHRYIHSSSPQFDPVNWYTQHATRASYQTLQEQATKKANESTTLNLLLRANNQMGTLIYAVNHEKACLSAVEKGLTLKQFRAIYQSKVPQQPISFPKTKVSLGEMIDGSSGGQTITIPNAASYNKHEAKPYNQQWDFLFEHCLDEDALKFYPSSLTSLENVLENKHDVTENSSEPWTRFEVVTSHLVPTSERNAGFDSILVMLRYLKMSHELHSLSVFYLQATTAAEHGISDEGVHLMKTWCHIMKTVYYLKEDQIFPSFIYLIDHLRFPTFVPKDADKLKSFIPQQNIWIAECEARGEIEVGTVRNPAMTASTAPVLDRFIDLPVNSCPQIVRCSFCGSLITEDFPDHYCEGMSQNQPMIRLNRGLIDALDRSNKPGLQPVEESTQTEKRSQPMYYYTSTEITIHEKQLDPIKISIDFVSTQVETPQKKLNSGLWPTIPSSSHQNGCVQIACEKLIPGTPDFYRLPFCPDKTEREGEPSALNQYQYENAQHQPNQAAAHHSSTQELSESLDDQSTIIEAHRQWVAGFKLDYENDNWQYQPVKLADQPYQSLEFDVPSVDITDHTLERQFMLPAVQDDSLGRINVDMENETDYLQNKRIQYEAFWQSLNRKNPPAGLDGTLQKDETELTERIQRCGDETQRSEPTVGIQNGGDETQRSEPTVGIQNGGDETQRSELTCILAKGLLIRSRLSLQSGNLKTATLLLERSKQHMVLNDTAGVEYELMLASDSVPETISHTSDDLERVAANAKNCFDSCWAQWIHEAHGLPILLSPSFHILQRHLKEIQNQVTTLGSYLEMFEVVLPITGDSRSGIAKNIILQTLMNGLNLQMLIAHGTGSWDQVDYFQRELISINRFTGLIPHKTISTPFKSQEEQIEELHIDCVMEAIGVIINTTRNQCDEWNTLIQPHQALGSGNVQKNEGKNRKKKTVLEDNTTVSQSPQILRDVSNDIIKNSPLFVSRINVIIATCHKKLRDANKTEMIRDLYQMIAQLSHFITIANEIDRTLFGKRKRGDDIDSRPFNPPSAVEKRALTITTSSPNPDSDILLQNGVDLSTTVMVLRNQKEVHTFPKQ